MFKLLIVGILGISLAGPVFADRRHDRQVATAVVGGILLGSILSKGNSSTSVGVEYNSYSRGSYYSTEIVYSTPRYYEPPRIYHPREIIYSTSGYYEPIPTYHTEIIEYHYHQPSSIIIYRE